MDLIIDFYKELDALNLIIFWGIIIVILLLLIFSLILINKNKKLKRIVEQNTKYEEELPIIKESVFCEGNNETKSELINPILNNQTEEFKEENVSELPKA